MACTMDPQSNPHGVYHSHTGATQENSTYSFSENVFEKAFWKSLVKFLTFLLTRDFSTLLGIAVKVLHLKPPSDISHSYRPCTKKAEGNVCSVFIHRDGGGGGRRGSTPGLWSHRVATSELVQNSLTFS